MGINHNSVIGGCCVNQRLEFISECLSRYDLTPLPRTVLVDGSDRLNESFDDCLCFNGPDCSFDTSNGIWGTLLHINWIQHFCLRNGK